MNQLHLIQNMFTPEQLRKLGFTNVPNNNTQEQKEANASDEEKTIKRLSLSLEEITSSSNSNENEDVNVEDNDEEDKCQSDSKTNKKVDDQNPPKMQENLSKSSCSTTKANNSFNIESLLAPTPPQKRPTISELESQVSILKQSIIKNREQMALPMALNQKSAIAASTMPNLPSTSALPTQMAAPSAGIIQNLIATNNKKLFEQSQAQSQGQTGETGEKKYSCHMCSKTFKRSSTLSTHWFWVFIVILPGFKRFKSDNFAFFPYLEY